MQKENFILLLCIVRETALQTESKMFLLRTLISSAIFVFVFSEIIVRQQTICHIKAFFDKFLTNYQLKCINIHIHETFMVTSDEISKCLWTHFEENLSIPVYHTHGFLNSLCDIHIFVDASKQTFEENDFPPFSKILLINTDLKHFNLHSIFLKSINVFSIKMDLIGNDLEVLPELISLINNKTNDWTNSNQDFLNVQNFIRILLRNQFGIKQLRAGYTDCAPSVITTEPILDGIEIRIVNETGKNWKISYAYQKDRGVSKDTVTNNVSDISLCTNWITQRNYLTYGLTKYIDLHCATFLVQRPTFLHSASYIYIPFNKYVWVAFLANFILTIFLLKILTTIGLKIDKKFWSSSKFNSLTYSFLEIVNTTTSHGVFKFPIHLPIKILLTAWMFMTLLVGTNFITRYTSLLTSPPTTKPIDTIQNFIDEGYIWGQQSVDQVLLELEYSQYYKELYGSFRNYSTAVPIDWLVTKKYGLFVKLLSDNNYVTATEGLSKVAGSLRLMKECLFQTYVAFVVQKNSDLTAIFDQKITQ